MKYTDDEIQNFLEKKTKLNLSISEDFTSKTELLISKYNSDEKPYLTYLLAAVILFSLAITYQFSSIINNNDIDYSDISTSYTTNLSESYYINYGYEE
jgi:hypothetical protein